MTDHPTPHETPENPGDSGPETEVRHNVGIPGATSERPISDTARRALMEAAARREAADRAPLPPEDGGPRGPEPTRYGDWEKKGLAVDF